MLPSLLQVTIDLNAEAKNYPDLLFTGANSTSQYIGAILAAIMAIAAIIVLIALVLGALDWINSSGDKGKIEKAREKITQAIIGLIVLAATLAIFNLVQSFAGTSILDFGNTKRSIPNTNTRGNSFNEDM